MNRIKFLKHLKVEGYVLLREGSKHSVFFNSETGMTSTVPRHSEVNDFLAKKICKDLGIIPVKKY